MSAKKLLEFVVASLLDGEAPFRVDEKHDELGTLLTLTLRSEDMGLIVGRSGRTVDAIRTVLRVYGSKAQVRVNLKLVEDPNPLQSGASQ